MPSFRVKAGMVVAIKTTAKSKKVFENLTERLTKAEYPSWVSVDPVAFSAKILNAPALENPNFSAQSIIEFYSR